MSTRTIEPLGYNVLVEPVDIPDKTSGGIHLPEQWKQPSGEAVVVAVGPGKYDLSGQWRKPSIQIGDRVIFPWIRGQDVNFDGRKFKILDVDELQGKVITKP